jgi:Coenzyme PQQ synthesis protein D (PqqD)
VVKLLGARFRISPDVLFHRLNDDVMIMDLRGDRFYSLNSVASQVWSFIAERGGVEGIIEKLLVEYETDELTLCSDITEFIGQIITKELVVVEG